VHIEAGLNKFAEHYEQMGITSIFPSVRHRTWWSGLENVLHWMK